MRLREPYKAALRIRIRTLFVVVLFRGGCGGFVSKTRFRFWWEERELEVELGEEGEEVWEWRGLLLLWRFGFSDHRHDFVGFRHFCVKREVK